MRKKIIHLLFGVSQLIFALLSGATSFQEEKREPQKRFIVKSPEPDGVQFRQRLLFPSSHQTGKYCNIGIL